MALAGPAVNMALAGGLFVILGFTGGVANGVVSSFYRPIADLL
jgi:hypothetical protein